MQKNEMICAREKVNSNDAVVRIYSWGPEAQGAPGTLRMISDNNGVYFPAYDPNGNVMGLVKASDGTVCAQYEYGPYGEEISATGVLEEEYSSGGELTGYSGVYEENSIRFSTKYYDTEARLYYYGYRYYSPDMGRWLSRDPFEEQGGLNLYAFVNNDPVNYCDLWGVDSSTFCGQDCNYGITRKTIEDRKKQSAFNYGVGWLLGIEQKERVFGPTTRMGKEIMRSEMLSNHRKKMRGKLRNYCQNKPTDLRIKLGSELKDIPKKKYVKKFLWDLIINPTESFVGSFTGGEITVIKVDCCCKKAIIHVHGVNESGWKSATHYPPKDDEYGEKSFLENDCFGVFGHTIIQIYDWCEIIRF